MRLSKTKINSYLICPLQFKWQFVNELPYENEAMKKGREIHEIVNKFFDSAKPEDDFIVVLKLITGPAFYDYEKELTNFAKMEKARAKNKYFKPLYRENAKPSPPKSR